MVAPAFIKDYIDKKFCAFAKFILARINEGSSGPAAGTDTSAPAMTKEELGAATGIPATQSSVYLTDGTGAEVYAWRNVNDTTSPASSTIIVDGDGVRWYIMSMRKVLDGLVTNYSPFP